MIAPDKVTLNNESGIGTITLNHAPANAYDIDLLQQLENAVLEANENGEIKVVMIESALSKFFCAGADIKTFGANDKATNQILVQQARSVAEQISQSSKIYIAAIEGHTLGGGLELAMACDLRFAAEGDYLLGLPEVKLGLIPGNGGTQRLLRLIGTSQALDLMATGRSINPKEALRLGLVDRLIPAAQHREETLAFARSLAEGPSLAIAAIKRSVNEGANLSLSEGLALEKSLVDPLYDTEDAAEGYASFAEKRPPQFKGK
ncbi:MAG: enoyl-CoA hydratase-related protein [Bacteroidota bacterium]